MMKTVFFCLVFATLAGCVNDLAEVDAVTSDDVFKLEEAENVSILYSDSAAVKVRITADKMIRYLGRVDPREEFPEGIFVEFLTPNGGVSSWMEADRATRYEKKGIVIAKGNARFYNNRKETLTSTELTWDESESKLSTNKWVRITQPMKGDTSYGFGFEANEEFTRFEIKNKTSSILNAETFKEKMDKKS